jgi:hypothetical protein
LVITLEIPVYPYKPTREIRSHRCRAKKSNRALIPKLLD